MVTLPVAPETVIPVPAMFESTPVLLNDVPSYESPVPAVVVATPVQPPLMNASTCPAAPVKRLFEVVAIESTDGVPPSTVIAFESASGPEVVSVVVATEPSVVLPEVWVKYARPETAMSVEVATSNALVEFDEPPTQTPLMAKQPAERLIPTFEVEVALPSMVRPESVVVPKPVAETESAVVDAELTTSNIFPFPPPQIVVVAYAVEVPTARSPVAVSRARSSPFVANPKVSVVTL
jgi:hypothetical protein